ncbi:hypothetical protein P2H44_12670 [Albimonas sp. CAU 1670]|uniref:hypothetical protein n=1 Tax=Albimonas sp. CAU 1670 TaxID=3032599 RepID=UPI0023D9DB0A|nr:hypothetical protein [Albimonas sp. CAU 1670]MDF2233407.1 hypothetical protein [Albimonas sp. CAU 1670]
MPRDETADQGPGDAGPPRPAGAEAEPEVGMAMPISESADDETAEEDGAAPAQGDEDHVKEWLDDLAAGLGERVTRIYVCTDSYVVFSTDDSDESSDLRALRYAVRRGDGRAFRERYHALSSDLAAMVTAIVGARPVLPWDVAVRNYEATRERAMWQAAQAVAAALDGDAQVAQGLATRAREAIETYRDSIVRSRYLVGASVALVLFVLVAFAFSGPARAFFGALGPEGAELPAVANLLLTGAVGSYFSVIYALGKVRVNHAISLAEMVVLGASRIATGVIAAGVAVLLIQGGWLMGGVDSERLSMTLLLFAFLAGFSEMFIPNALKETEAKTRVESPAPAPAPAAPSRPASGG